MEARVGDRIVVESESTAQAARTGEIEEIFEGTPPRFRVHWSDGKTTIFVPSAGAARIERAKRSAAAR